MVLEYLRNKLRIIKKIKELNSNPRPFDELSPAKLNIRSGRSLSKLNHNKVHWDSVLFEQHCRWMKRTEFWAFSANCMKVIGLHFQVVGNRKDWLPFLTYYGLKNGLLPPETRCLSRSFMMFEPLACRKQDCHLTHARPSLDFNGHLVWRKRQGQGIKYHFSHS